MEQNKVYLITGASSEVGMAFIKKLDEKSSDAVRVVAHYGNRKEDLEQLQTKLIHVKMDLVQADLSVTQGAEKICDYIKEKQLKITHVLHLAAPAFQYVKIKNGMKIKQRKRCRYSFFLFHRL